MIVDYEFLLAVRSCYVDSAAAPPYDADILMLTRHEGRYAVLDTWGNLRWFEREQDAHWDLRRLRQEAAERAAQAHQD